MTLREALKATEEKYGEGYRPSSGVKIRKEIVEMTSQIASQVDVSNRHITEAFLLMCCEKFADANEVYEYEHRVRRRGKERDNGTQEKE